MGGGGGETFYSISDALMSSRHLVSTSLYYSVVLILPNMISFTRVHYFV